MWQERHLISPNVTGDWDLVILAFFQSSYQRTFHSSGEIGDTAGLNMGPTLGLTPGSPGTQGPNCLAEVNQWGEGRSPNLSLNMVSQVQLWDTAWVHWLQEFQQCILALACKENHTSLETRTLTWPPGCQEGQATNAFQGQKESGSAAPRSAMPKTQRPGSLHLGPFCSSPGEAEARSSTISPEKCAMTLPRSPDLSIVNA